MPELDLMYHIPNGGKRDIATAKRLKAEGVKAGVPDICLPVPRGVYHGLYIELKAGENKTTRKQNEWLEALDNNGYFTAVCYGWEEASKVITNYLKNGGSRENV
ncbi:VRR-NUC domain-containing protein [Ruminiclostridium herbifermentans]|uniref:VRR-NUC domain-containing protein n=2 Tax=Ruminiclostridium herbifermentans TaxID=2488810 RepID=A0A4U7J6R8_9FIRM|nr:VRR-NUC domain-containing protein [Ruminiclostridium herbifermentans]QNU68698.1 VRR-NUC domain-containing protein [Ruminiclostridium herbifermentans]